MANTQILIRASQKGTVAITASSTTITGTNTNFQSTDVGKEIKIRTDDGFKVHIIATVVSTTSITVTVAPDFTQATCYYYLKFNTLDIGEDIAFTTNYSIADIREPEKKGGTATKTIVVPGTKNNNIILGHLFEIGASGTFNPNISADAMILHDTIPLLIGSLQLVKITDDYGRIEYECIIYGKLINLFDALGDAEMTDLDLSEYDHDWTMTNQVNSWDTKIVKNGSDYVNFSGGNPTGEGYVYPLINYGQTADNITYAVEHLYPAIYVKELIDKILAYAGYSYTSAFLTSQLFKRLIIPGNFEKMRRTNAEILALQFRASYLANTDFYTIQSHANILAGASKRVAFPNDSTAPNNDPGGQYSIVNGVFSASDSMIVDFATTIDWRIRYAITGFVNPDDVLPENTIVQGIGIYVKKPGDASTYGSIAAFKRIDLNFIKSGELQRFIDTVGGSPATSLTYRVTLEAKALRLNAGDLVTVVYTYGKDAAGVNAIPGDTGTAGYRGGTGTFVFQVMSGSYYMNTVSPEIIQGGTVSLSKFLPDKLKMRDFLKSIFQMFNLFVQDDPDTSRALLIEPRDTYYSAGTQVDWTQKIDLSKPIQILPMGELTNSRYVFTYKQDSDYYNDKYFKAYDRIYGDRRINVDNDFVKDDKSVDVIFSPTPLVARPISNRVYPEIVKESSDGGIQPYPGNIRILYYGGLKDSTPAWRHWSKSPSNTYTERSTYPYAGHFDDPYDPTLDINWGLTKEVYYTRDNQTDKEITLTNNNLYNAYWKNAIEEIIDPESKLVQIFMRLSPIDIANLDFRNEFKVDNQLYRINRIVDYDNTGGQSCMVEFIKVKKQLAFTAETAVTTGGSDLLLGQESVAKLGRSMQQALNGNILDVSHDPPLIKGTGNYIAPSSRNWSIIGDGNTIFDDTSGIVIFSSGVTVMPGVQNVLVVDSPGLVVTESNATYMNGIKVSGGTTTSSPDLIDGGLDTVRPLDATSYYHVIDGGRDVVRPLDSTSAIMMINGGQTTSNE